MFTQKKSGCDNCVSETMDVESVPPTRDLTDHNNKYNIGNSYLAPLRAKSYIQP